MPRMRTWFSSYWNRCFCAKQAQRGNYDYLVLYVSWSITFNLNVLKRAKLLRIFGVRYKNLGYSWMDESTWNNIRFPVSVCLLIIADSFLGVQQELNLDKQFSICRCLWFRRLVVVSKGQECGSFLPVLFKR